MFNLNDHILGQVTRPTLLLASQAGLSLLAFPYLTLTLVPKHGAS